MLNNKELATVANRLQVPLVISDILSGDGALTDDVQYGLHAVISDLQPDSALLSIALGGLKIANLYHKASPGIAVLKMQCESIVDDYATLWLQNAQLEEIDEHETMDALSRVSEDLEGIGELLELSQAFLQSKDQTASELAKILAIQAKSHAIIADEFFGALYTKMTQDIAQMPKMPAALAGKEIASNVIPFRQRKAG